MWICFAVAHFLLLYSPNLHKLQTNLNSSHTWSNDILIISLRNLMSLVPKIHCESLLKNWFWEIFTEKNNWITQQNEYSYWILIFNEKKNNFTYRRKRILVIKFLEAFKYKGRSLVFLQLYLSLLLKGNRGPSIPYLLVRSSACSEPEDRRIFFQMRGSFSLSNHYYWFVLSQVAVLNLLLYFFFFSRKDGSMFTPIFVFCAYVQWCHFVLWSVVAGQWQPQPCGWYLLEKPHGYSPQYTWGPLSNCSLILTL